jgi:hypothetical protein
MLTPKMTMTMSPVDRRSSSTPSKTSTLIKKKSSREDARLLIGIIYHSLPLTFLKYVLAFVRKTNSSTVDLSWYSPTLNGGLKR